MATIYFISLFSCLAFPTAVGWFNSPWKYSMEFCVSTSIGGLHEDMNYQSDKKKMNSGPPKESKTKYLEIIKTEFKKIF